MNVAREIVRLLILGGVNHQITHIVTRSGLFGPVRQWAASVHPKLGELFGCPLCFGTWVGLLQALVFRPRFVEPGRPGAPALQPRLLRRFAAFSADALAIALAGRLFTEIFAILAGEAALTAEREQLIHQQVERLESGGCSESAI